MLSCGFEISKKWKGKPEKKDGCCWVVYLNDKRFTIRTKEKKDGFCRVVDLNLQRNKRIWKVPKKKKEKKKKRKREKEKKKLSQYIVNRWRDSQWQRGHLRRVGGLLMHLILMAAILLFAYLKFCLSFLFLGYYKPWILYPLWYSNFLSLNWIELFCIELLLLLNCK